MKTASVGHTIARHLRAPRPEWEDFDDDSVDVLPRDRVVFEVATKTKVTHPSSLCPSCRDGAGRHKARRRPRRVTASCLLRTPTFGRPHATPLYSAEATCRTWDKAGVRETKTRCRTACVSDGFRSFSHSN